MVNLQTYPPMVCQTAHVAINYARRPRLLAQQLKKGPAPASCVCHTRLRNMLPWTTAMDEHEPGPWLRSS